MMKSYQIDFGFDRMVGLYVDYHSPWINIIHTNNESISIEVSVWMWVISKLLFDCIEVIYAFEVKLNHIVWLTDSPYDCFFS